MVGIFIGLATHAIKEPLAGTCLTVSQALEKSDSFLQVAGSTCWSEADGSIEPELSWRYSTHLAELLYEKITPKWMKKPRVVGYHPSIGGPASF